MTIHCNYGLKYVQIYMKHALSILRVHTRRANTFMWAIELVQRTDFKKVLLKCANWKPFLCLIHRCNQPWQFDILDQLKTLSRDQEFSTQNGPAFTRKNNIVKTDFKSLQGALLSHTTGLDIVFSNERV